MGSSKTKFLIEVEVCVLIPEGVEYDIELFARQMGYVSDNTLWPSNFTDGKIAPPMEFSPAMVEKEREGEIRFRVRSLSHVVVADEHEATYRKYGDRLAKSIARIIPGRALGAYACFYRSWPV